jgi:AraC-like DNA-binding protein
MESGLHEADIRERVIPTENLQLMFHFRDPFVVCHPDNTISLQPRSILSGLNDTYADVSTCGETGVIFVTFFPAGACHFFNFALSEVENRSINLGDIFSAEVRRTEEKLANGKTVPDLIHIIEDFLIQRFNPVPEVDYAIALGGVEMIRKTNGQISTPSLASELSVSSRSLERKFAAYIGKSPKQFMRLVRFQNTILDISRNRNFSLTGYAYRNGYYDQSHFIREFKQLSGYTPGEFFKIYGDCDLETELGSQ